MEISPIYHNSRPEGKLPAQEAAAFDFLDSLGIDYERVTHELANTMEKCDDVSAVLGVDVCKNLFLCNRQKTNFYLLCMPPHKAFHTKDLSHQIGSARLSFAPEEQLWDLLHCTPGSATILGLMNDDENRVQLLIDKETDPSLIEQGDVVTFIMNEEGMLVTHRVVSIDRTDKTFTTKGDANNVAVMRENETDPALVGRFS